ncbi:hypothetical protein IJI02_00560 [Candidatus Saccharibacteria bacterium]|nr:hypothetical protein [Candidatus Saccharibacteria bacterium]
MTSRRLLLGLSGFLFAFVATLTFLQFSRPTSSSAASLDAFDPGLIISDYTMSNASTMSEADIQAFLTSKNSCTNTNRAYYDALSAANPSASWHWQDDHFVCLSEELFGDGEIIGSGDTAAHIIYTISQEYSINPQVLLVLLQKETGLITDPIPNNYDYRKATGFGCPDTAACSAEYYGFKNQLRHAAALFRTVLDGGWTNYPLGENYVRFSPDASCGGSTVNIRSLATSALYRYTPYQPNAAALAAGYGTAVCGAYGNRNFYLYFLDYFGYDPSSSPVAQGTAASEPTAEEILARLQPIDPVASDLALEYSAHVQKLGWMDWSNAGEMAGTTGFSLRLEALKIRLKDKLSGIEYRSYVEGSGWETSYRKDGAESGLTGQSKRLEALEIRLTGSLADEYDIYYRTHIQNIGWTDWSKNGAVSGAPGEGLRLEALQIKVVKKPKQISALSYRAHVQNIGWQDWVKNGALAGTFGQSLRLEALEIKLSPKS